MRLTAIIEREGDGYVSLCPELDIASQGGWLGCAFSPAKEVCAVLTKHGLIEIRQHGSHAIMQRRTPDATTTVPVPLHAEIRIGTLHSIIRQSRDTALEIQIDRSFFEARIQSIILLWRDWSVCSMRTTLGSSYAHSQ